jgi:hypothetical protein
LNAPLTASAIGRRLAGAEIINAFQIPRPIHANESGFWMPQVVGNEKTRRAALVPLMKTD